MKKESYRGFNIRILISFFAILLILALFNIIVDPFSIFNLVNIKNFNELKPDKNRQQRITKVVELKLEKKPVDVIFLGSSRVDKAIDTEYFYNLTGKNAKNLAMNALTNSELIKIAKNAHAIHPEIKTMYAGLDFFRFLKYQADDGRTVNMTLNKNLTISEFNPLVLSFDTTIASVNTIIANIKHKDNASKEDPTGIFEYRLKQYSDSYKDMELSTIEIQKLANFKKEMQKKGVEVVFYLNPTHATDLQLIKEKGGQKVFEEWKRALAQNFNYIDFDIVNDATGENIDQNTKYFYESSHSTTEMGKLVINRLTRLTDDPYGKKVDKKNINVHLKNADKALIKWSMSNENWANKVKKIAKGGEK